MPILLVKRVKVSLELFRMSVSFLIGFGLTVSTSMAGNLLVPTPPITLLDLNAALADLQTAFEAAQTGGPEATATMLAKRQVVITMLNAIGGYVEFVANSPANVGDAITVILSCGMLVKGFSPRQKQTWSLFAGSLLGTVEAKAVAVKRGTHEWQYTLTPLVSGSWIALPSTTKAKTTITGLTSATVVYVRHRAVLKTGPGNWDTTLSVVVP